MKRHQYLILRLGLGIVFLIFSIGKFRNDIWVQTIKSLPILQSLIPFSLDTLVILIGISEVIIALLLILGFFTRVAAFFALVELVIIFFLLKFQEVREIGLIAMALVLLLERSEWHDRYDRRRGFVKELI